MSDLRQGYPDTAFETRSLEDSDGMTYVMVMPITYWHWLEVVLMTGERALEEIIEFCTSLAHRAVSDEGWRFDCAFRELLMYYIYRHIQDYKNTRDNLANDNWDDCLPLWK